MAETRRWRIEGRVQGVFFRASTRRQAEKLGLTGHAINLDDGAVDVLAHGDADSLGKLEAWLHRGPAAAKVKRVVVLEAEAEEPPDDFTTA